ncbi:hypothetical protein EF405_04740 [Cyclobacteriaceae bacterium YHN15]|nr:hypothetical protein EF405_04740 [Cyclobacteriaceae bacterium YHN15]
MFCSLKLLLCWIKPIKLIARKYERKHVITRIKSDFVRFFRVLMKLVLIILEFVICTNVPLK